MNLLFHKYKCVYVCVHWISMLNVFLTVCSYQRYFKVPLLVTLCSWNSWIVLVLLSGITVSVGYKDVTRWSFLPSSPSLSFIIHFWKVVFDRAKRQEVNEICLLWGGFALKNRIGPKRPHPVHPKWSRGTGREAGSMEERQIFNQ